MNMEYECVLHIFCLMWRSDSPLTPLQERGIVTTGKRGLSVPAIAEHPLSPPETANLCIHLFELSI